MGLDLRRTGEAFEFMAISLSVGEHRCVDNWRSSNEYLESSKLYRTLRWLSGGGYRLLVVNVLLIDRLEKESFARRIGVGWVYLEDWIQAKQGFKTICLV